MLVLTGGCGASHAAHQAQVWLVTFASYMAFHWARKVYSVVKVQLGPSLGLSTGEVGALDTIFLVSYALCMPFSGCQSGHAIYRCVWWAYTWPGFDRLRVCNLQTGDPFGPQCLALLTDCVCV